MVSLREQQGSGSLAGCLLVDRPGPSGTSVLVWREESGRGPLTSAVVSLAPVRSTADLGTIALFPYDERTVDAGVILPSRLDTGQTGGTSRRVRLAGHRTVEREWRRAHKDELKQFVGQWVVLEENRIVAHGENPNTVLAQAKERGIQVPYMFYVQPFGRSEVKMGL